jgi:hypothetical protein
VLPRKGTPVNNGKGSLWSEFGRCNVELGTTGSRMPIVNGMIGVRYSFIHDS